MTKPFLGYTDQQSDTIYGALIEANLKRDANWPHLRRLITDKMHEVTSPEVAHQENVYAGDIKRRLKKLIKALNATMQAHKELGDVLQWHLDDALRSVPLIKDGHSSDWRTTVRCLLSSDRFPGTLDAVRQAADSAAEKQISYASIQKTGAPKNHVMRLAVRELLGIFEIATGISPKVYASEHCRDGYAGNFYAFAVASLAPMRLVPRRSLGSAILAAYKEWKGVEKV